MKNINYSDELKKLDILIFKKMFSVPKERMKNDRPSPLQFRIIEYLLKSKDHDVCQKELEDKFNVSKATISGALLTMENKGIIKRISAENDARKKHIELTEVSLEKLTSIKNLRNKIDEVMIKDIKEEELEVFILVIRKMIKNLEESDF